MGLQSVSTTGAPEAIGPYSQAVIASGGPNGWVFCSGQVALEPGKAGALVGADVGAQTRRALQNLSAVLEEAGSSLSRVVKTTVYLTDMANFTAMNQVYAELFGTHRPARATVAVAGLPRGALVEIEAIALR
ncbi:MAG TPA: Rid family detoxifying hydrolase [Myxococcota bacterium]|nr:Rid family detoxifying hydrolase [Myxococcota bacterium]